MIYDKPGTLFLSNEELLEKYGNMPLNKDMNGIIRDVLIEEKFDEYIDFTWYCDQHRAGYIITIVNNG